MGSDTQQYLDTRNRKRNQRSDNRLRLLWSDINEEMRRGDMARANTYPTDPLRQAALVAEEAGETLAAALDMTRLNPDRTVAEHKVLVAHYREELIHTGAMVLKALLTIEAGR